jgi:hypothetical protein
VGKLPPGTRRTWGGKEYIKLASGKWRRYVAENYKETVQGIVKRIRSEESEGISRPQEPLEKIKLGAVSPWIVENARDVGLNIDGYGHEISNYFIRHVIKSHGNTQKEASRGNLPIQDDDFQKIPAIIEKPDHIILGAKRNNEDRIIYVKILEDGTMLYFEEVLTGKSNKSLRGNTLYKTKKILDIKGVIANIGMNGKTDLSKIKITGMDGSYSINTANKD